MGILDLFGGSKNAEKVVETAADGIYNGLDKMVYTDEEKADARKKGVDAFLEFVKLAYDGNSLRSVTRRWMAWSIVALNELLAVIATVFAILGEDAIVQSIINVAVAFNLGWAFVAVIIFYFGVSFFRIQK